MESECRVAWADLPAELLALISDGLEERCDISRFRGVCRTWRSAVMGITNNNLSHLFPRRLSLSRPSVMGLYEPCESDLPKYVVAMGVYLVKDPKSSVANWIVSVQESESGKLLLRNLLTCEPIPGYKGYGFDMLSGWSLTRLSSYHCFRSTCACWTCRKEITTAKVVVRPVDADADSNSNNSMVIFRLGDEYGGVRALRLSNEPTTGQLVGRNSASIADFVNFNGCIYAVDDEDVVYVLDNAGLQMVGLTCVNLPRYPWASWETAGGKRFVVSDGNLYLVFNFCVSRRCMLGEYDHYKVYKLVMNDLNAPTCYHSERTENLGDCVFFITKDCSFSVSARQLPPPLCGALFGNRLVVGKSAFVNCRCLKELYIYPLGVGDPPILRLTESYTIEPPQPWLVSPGPHDYAALLFKHPKKLNRFVSRKRTRSRGQQVKLPKLLTSPLCRQNKCTCRLL